MAAIRSFEAESVFCEQMVEHAQAASFRNRWDRDRLRFWDQRLRAARAAIPAKNRDQTKNTGIELPGRETFKEGEPGSQGAPGSSVPAPLAALPDPPAPTLFDKEAA